MFVFGVLVVWGLALEFRVSVSLTFVQIRISELPEISSVLGILMRPCR